MSVRLLLCPFCGGEPKLRSIQSGEDCTDTWVECANCGARTDAVEAPYSEPEMAAAFWNARHRSEEVHGG